MKSPRIKVLQGFVKPTSRSNPYVTLLATSFPPEIVSSYFTWKMALFGSYDVLHIQWVEHFTSSGPGVRGLIKRALLRALALRLRLKFIPLIVTQHNESPHDPVSPRDGQNYRRFSSLVSQYVVLNPHTRVPGGREATCIPHGHYRDWYATAQRKPSNENTVLFFGMVRPYKNIEDLIAAFRSLDIPARLRIMGSPKNPAYANELADLASVCDNIELELAHVDDDRLAVEISQAQLVALPYRAMHNSGAALLALSLNTPVLLLDNEVNRDLQEEVGKDFVHLFRHELTSAQLKRTLIEISQHARPDREVDMSARNWDRIGQLHADLYRSALMARCRPAQKVR